MILLFSNNLRFFRPEYSERGVVKLSFLYRPKKRLNGVGDWQTAINIRRCLMNIEILLPVREGDVVSFRYWHWQTVSSVPCSLLAARQSVALVSLFHHLASLSVQFDAAINQ